MKTVLKLTTLACAAFALSACYRNDTARQQVRTQWDDNASAQVTCVGYSGLMYDGFSRGPVEYDEGGRITLIDRATGKLVKTEGECVVRYDR